MCLKLYVQIENYIHTRTESDGEAMLEKRKKIYLCLYFSPILKLSPQAKKVAVKTNAILKRIRRKKHRCGNFPGILQEFTSSPIE